MRGWWLLAVLSLGGCVTAGALSKASIRNEKDSQVRAQLGDGRDAKRLHESAVAAQENARLIDARRTSWLHADVTLE